MIVVVVVALNEIWSSASCEACCGMVAFENFRSKHPSASWFRARIFSARLTYTSYEDSMKTQKSHQEILVDNVNECLILSNGSTAGHNKTVNESRSP